LEPVTVLAPPRKVMVTLMIAASRKNATPTGVGWHHSAAKRAVWAAER